MTTPQNTAALSISSVSDSLQDLVIDPQAAALLEDDPSEVTFSLYPSTSRRNDESQQQPPQRLSSHGEHRTTTTNSSSNASSGTSSIPYLPQQPSTRSSSGNNNNTHSSHSQSTPPLHHHANRHSSTRSPLAPNQANRSTKLMQHLPMAQLQRTTSVLRGRETELQILQNCVTDLRDHHRTQFVLIGGVSGVGKSALAKSIIHNERDQQPQSASPTNTGTSASSKIIMVQGKFDLMNRNEPYQAILMAFHEICGCLLEQFATTGRSAPPPPDEESSSSPLQQFSDDIVQGLGSELSLLLEMMPILEEVLILPKITMVTTDASSSSSTHHQRRPRPQAGGDDDNAKNRINYAFQTVLRLAARHLQHPLVLFIDDLQWADMPSLELLDAFLTDMTNDQGIMVVGAYRSNEVNESTHILHRFVNDWIMRHEEVGFAMIQMDIGNLSEAAVKLLIQDMTRIDDDRVDELSQLCFQKTQGNAFFVKFFISTLAEKNLLQFNFATMSWKWASLSEIEEKMPSSDNVIDLLVEKLQQQSSPESIFVLQVAACMGATFSTKLLETVMNDLPKAEGQNELASETGNDAGDDDDGSSARGVQRILNGLVDEGYVEQAGMHHYRFTHDKVQEACLKLLPSKEALDTLCQRIGQSLLTHIEETPKLESLLPHWVFTVTDLLNKSSSSSLDVATMPALRMAELNSLACQKALSVSAFEAASTYAACGIALLDKNAWTEHCDLCIELYSNGAQAESALSNVQVMEPYCHTVIKQTHVPTEQKFRVYRALVSSMAMRLMAKYASDKCLEVLSQFRVVFPKNKVSILAKTAAQLITIKASVKEFAENQLMDLPMMQDPLRHELLGFLERLSSFFYFTDDPRLPLALFKPYFWTKEFGISSFTPVAVAKTAVIMVGVLQDFETGALLGRKSLELLDKFESNIRSPIEAVTLMIVNSFALAWSTPFKDRIPSLLWAYELSLKVGDVENAGHSSFFFTCFRFMSGVPLDQVAADVKMYALQMKNLKQLTSHQLLHADLQMYLNLMGENSVSSDLSELEGQIFTKEEATTMAHANAPFRHAVTRNTAMLYCFFGEHEKLARLVLQNKGEDLPLIGAPNLMYHAFVRGVSCFAAFRATKNRGYEKMAMMMRSKIKRWVSKGNPNVVHFDKLLDAENAATKGRFSDAASCFESSIQFAARSGYIHDAALACERYGEYCLERGDSETSRYQLEKSVEFWKAFGAHGKVLHIQSRHATLWPLPVMIQASGEFTGKGNDATIAAHALSSDFQTPSSDQLQDRPYGGEAKEHQRKRRTPQPRRLSLQLIPSCRRKSASRFSTSSS